MLQLLAAYTYNSVLTVQIVTTGVVISALQKAGELLLGSLAGVHLDSATTTTPSSHHNPVFKFNGASSAEN